MVATTPCITPAWEDTALESGLFAGFDREELRRVVTCLGVRVRSFGKGETLVAGGVQVTSIGLLLRGSAYNSRLNENGSRDIVGPVLVHDVFAEDALVAAGSRSILTVTGSEAGQVLELGSGRILNPGGPLCELRSRLVENLFRIVVAKNQQLQSKLEMLATKSLRERISLFLNAEQLARGSRQFTVIFSRAELADYLNADRAALSRELARMKAERLIDFHRSSFAILAKR